MAQEMPAEQKALPVLKVIYRNANRIQERGVKAGEVLHRVAPRRFPRADPAAKCCGKQFARRT